MKKNAPTVVVSYMPVKFHGGKEHFLALRNKFCGDQQNFIARDFSFAHSAKKHFP